MCLEKKRHSILVENSQPLVPPFSNLAGKMLPCRTRAISTGNRLKDTCRAWEDLDSKCHTIQGSGGQRTHFPMLAATRLMRGQRGHSPFMGGRARLRGSHAAE